MSLSGPEGLLSTYVCVVGSLLEFWAVWGSIVDSKGAVRFNSEGPFPGWRPFARGPRPQVRGWLSFSWWFPFVKVSYLCLRRQCFRSCLLIPFQSVAMGLLVSGGEGLGRFAGSEGVVSVSSCLGSSGNSLLPRVHGPSGCPGW